MCPSVSLSLSAFIRRSSFNRRCSFHTQCRRPLTVSSLPLFIALAHFLFAASSAFFAFPAFPATPAPPFLGAHWILLCAQIVLVFKLKARDCFYASFCGCHCSFCFPLFFCCSSWIRFRGVCGSVCDVSVPGDVLLPSSVSCCLRKRNQLNIPVGLSGPRYPSAFNVVPKPLSQSLSLSLALSVCVVLSLVLFRLLLGTCLTRNYFGPVALFTSLVWERVSERTRVCENGSA